MDIRVEKRKLKNTIYRQFAVVEFKGRKLFWRCYRQTHRTFTHVN